LKIRRGERPEAGVGLGWGNSDLWGESCLGTNPGVSNRRERPSDQKASRDASEGGSVGECTTTETGAKRLFPSRRGKGGDPSSARKNPKKKRGGKENKDRAEGRKKKTGVVGSFHIVWGECNRYAGA